MEQTEAAVVLVVAAPVALDLADSTAIRVRSHADAAHLLAAPQDWSSIVFVRSDDPDAADVADHVRPAGGTVVLIVDEREERAYERVVELRADTYVREPLSVIEMAGLARRERQARERAPEAAVLPDAPAVIAGNSRVIRRLRDAIEAAAFAALPVLVTGEHGTGKAFVANAVHRLSPHRYSAIATRETGAEPTGLGEESSVGFYEDSETGLLVQEGEEQLLTAAEQFMHPLRHGTVISMDPVHMGGPEVQVRIRAATSPREELSGSASAKQVEVLHIELEPLRGRDQDILAIWRHFVANAAVECGRDELHTSVDVERALRSHQWPGNITELKSAARWAVAMCQSDTIQRVDLPSSLRNAGPHLGIRIPGMSLDELERVAILKTYEATGSVRRTAEILEVSERKIFYRLKQYRKHDPALAKERRKHLAIVDEDVELRLSMHELLSRSYVVTGYESVGAFIEGLGVAQPDVLVCGVCAPPKRGVDLLAELRRRAIEIPVIMMGDRKTLPRKVRQSRSHIWMDKPIDAIALGQHLSQLVGGS